MKISLLAIAIFSILFSASCSKNKDEDQIFLKSDIIGLWEQSDGDDFKSCPSGDNPRIEITENEFRSFFTSSGGCLTLGYIAHVYKFDGKVIYSDDGIVTMKVLGVNNIHLHLSDGKNTMVYIKISK